MRETIWFAVPVVVATGLYFVGLAAVALLRPAQATRFFLGFAGSARTHYLELTIRLVVGCAFLLAAPSLLASEVFQVAGWALIVTTTGLLMVPWRWHRAFAARSVPQAMRFLKPMAVVSFLVGTGILVAVVGGRGLAPT